MNVSADKVEIIQWVASLENKAILQQLKQIKAQHTAVSVSEMEQKSIQKGIDDSRNGRVQPHSEIRKKYEKWL